MKHIISVFVLLLSGFYCSGQQFISMPTGQTQPNGTPFQVNFNVVNVTGNCTSQTLIINLGHLKFRGNISAMNQYYGSTVTESIDGTGNTIVTISNIQNSSGSGGSSRYISIGAEIETNTCNGTTANQNITASTQSCNNQTLQQGNLQVTAAGTTNKANMFFYPTTSPQNPNGFCLNEAAKYALYVTNTDVNIFGYKSGFNVNNVKVKIKVPKCAQILIYRVSTFDSTGLTYTEATAEATATTKTYILENTNNSVLNLESNTAGQLIQSDYYFDVYLKFPCNNPSCVDGLNDIKADLVGDYCGTTFTKSGNVFQTDFNTACSIDNCNTSGTGGFLINYYDYGIKCLDSCTPSTLSISLTTPPNSIAYGNKEFVVNVPTGVELTGAGVIGVPCNGSTTNSTIISPVYYLANGTITSSAALARVVKWTWPSTCTDRIPSLGFSVTFKYNDNTPANTHFQFGSSFVSGATTIVSKTHEVVPESICRKNFYLQKDVKRVSDDNDSQFSNFSSGFPGDVYTYKLSIYNYSDGENENSTLQDILSDKLEYLGNLKYTVGSWNDNATPIPLNSGDIIPDYGNHGVIVQAPSSGNNTLKLSGLDFGCEGISSEYLTFYFDVKMKPNVTAGELIANSFKLDGFPSSGTAIQVGSKTNVTTAMFGKCASSENEWVDSAIRVKNGETVSFKMKFTNEGTVPVNLESLINQKPQSNDKFEVGSTIPRNSAFAINYNCAMTPTVSVNPSILSDPTITSNYSTNATNDSGGVFQCSPDVTWTGSCGVNSNWLQVKFPAGGFTLQPAQSIEVIYQGTVSASALGNAYNSFSFKLAGCGLLPTDLQHPLMIINDGLGCDIPQPCSDLVWSTDGSFETCLGSASNTFNASVDCGQWHPEQNTPDLLKLPLTSDPAYPINTAGINALPAVSDNRVFIGAAAKQFRLADRNKVESFKTTIPNLVVGTSYKLEFQQINLTNPIFGGNSVNWKVKFGNQIQYSPDLATGSGPISWSTVTLNFVATSTSEVVTFEANAPTFRLPHLYPFLYTSAFTYIGIDNIKVTSNNPCPVPVPCYDCTSFDPLNDPYVDEKYLVSAWVKEEDPTKPDQQYKSFPKSCVSISFLNTLGYVIDEELKFYPTGEIIDGWQRIVGEFSVPESGREMKFELVNENTDQKITYFDDVRVLPSKGNMKSFVYDQKTHRLMAELDENNYSTFYEYDIEGGLVRIKKETEKGVFTIQETRSGNTKKE